MFDHVTSSRSKLNFHSEVSYIFDQDLRDVATNHFMGTLAVFSSLVLVFRKYTYQ